MRQLAGVHQPYYWSAFPLFERMMNELGRPKLDRSKCLKMVVVVRLRGLLQGRAEPGPVARDIGRVWLPPASEPLTQSRRELSSI